MYTSESSQQPILNRLLAALPSEAYASLLPSLETVSLVFQEVLYEPREPIKYVYFPTNGLVSLLTSMADNTLAEVGVVGNEGMVGLPIFLGIDTTPFRAIVQIPGSAMRMKADVFKDWMNQVNPLYGWLQRYTHALMIQISQFAACSRIHSVEQRCCQWLLMMHDSVNRLDEFPVTQDFLAQMLSVRRASVTEVAGRLQKAGILRYNRGQMTLLDRRGLEASSCECYEIVKAEFDRLLS